NEVFSEAEVLRYVGGIARESGLDDGALLKLGRFGEKAGFGLTPLALRLSAHANGVSKLHGEVAREMWAGLWPERNGDAPPIGHVTNGVHLGTWLEAPPVSLMGQAGVRPEAPPGEAGWEAAEQLAPEALWEVHDA